MVEWRELPDIEDHKCWGTFDGEYKSYVIIQDGHEFTASTMSKGRMRFLETQFTLESAIKACEDDIEAGK